VLYLAFDLLFELDALDFLDKGGFDEGGFILLCEESA
jgi:hypothetical protein